MAKKTYVTPDAGATWVQVASETTDLSAYVEKTGDTMTGDLTTSGIIRADSDGPDGGMVMRRWTGGSTYTSLATNGMTGNEYLMISGTGGTYVSASAGGDVYIRPNANTSGYQLKVDAAGAHTLGGALDLSSTLNAGAVLAGGSLGSAGKVSGSLANQGLGFFSTSSFSTATASGGIALYAQRLQDGGVLALVSGTSTEGTISISGTTTTYGSFCGAHWSQFKGITRPDILPGTVVETIDEMCEWWDEEGVLQPNDQLAKVKVSDTPESKAVYGVFQRYDDEEGGVNDIMVASIGAWLCRIQAGEIIEVGDLLDSAGNGCAKVQSDDIMRSRTIAKVTSTIPYATYEDGSFVVPVTLHCG